MTATVARVAETIVVAPIVSPLPETESVPPARKPVPSTTRVAVSRCFTTDGETAVTAGSGARTVSELASTTLAPPPSDGWL